ncbi:putative AIG2-like protein [Desulfosarcina cetonica]|uniref:gamma-glutamylcyclotransferase family protein n=1 Tax=Desulfosarcina cetonica TaxID=90730 RepID=UPI0006D0B320|nr:gamma-glutamylcyclotransferase family protein [Desulfosarcina cetonica]VTR67723.1 putative AIG2-like protein [Desulfosarcina cetonica]
MVNRLFVYGTLAPGRSNEHVLSCISGAWEPASVTGTLLPEAWGAAAGYPGIILDEHGDEVQGFLFSSEHLAEHWSRLDQFEGDGYERVLTKARLKDGSIVNAYIYQLSKSGLPGTALETR